MMNNKFGIALKEFRTNKRISQIDLADALLTSRAVITSWEDGSGLPARKSIKDLAKILKLNADETDNLLTVANYEKLSGTEVVDLVGFNLSSAGLLLTGRDINHGELSNFFNSTGTVMGGTIGSLDDKVNAIENTLGIINSSIAQLKSGNNFDIAERIENEIKPLSLEVKAIKDEIVPKLEETKNQLSKSDDFIRRNANFFMSAVEGEGAIKVIRSELTSLEKRLEKIENQLNISKDRTVAIVAAIFALISVCVACISLTFPIYQLISSR